MSNMVLRDASASKNIKKELKLIKPWCMQILLSVFSSKAFEKFIHLNFSAVGKVSWKPECQILLKWDYEKGKIKHFFNYKPILKNDLGHGPNFFNAPIRKRGLKSTLMRDDGNML